MSNMFLWYKVGMHYAQDIFRKVTMEWIGDVSEMSIDYTKDVLCNKQRMKEMSDKFSEKTGGIMHSCIGSIDGWLV